MTRLSPSDCPTDTRALTKSTCSLTTDICRCLKSDGPRPQPFLYHPDLIPIRCCLGDEQAQVIRAIIDPGKQFREIIVIVAPKTLVQDALYRVIPLLCLRVNHIENLRFVIVFMAGQDYV